MHKKEKSARNRHKQVITTGVVPVPEQDELTLEPEAANTVQPDAVQNAVPQGSWSDDLYARHRRKHGSKAPAPETLASLLQETGSLAYQYIQGQEADPKVLTDLSPLGALEENYARHLTRSLALLHNDLTGIKNAVEAHRETTQKLVKVEKTENRQAYFMGYFMILVALLLLANLFAIAVLNTPLRETLLNMPAVHSFDGGFGEDKASQTDK